ncbi:MAG: oligosaccharide flippase family protein [Flavobacteriales bacterium]|nr:oligosaccharide flippase family protein [Flavobacteriales bacterium]
MGEIQKQSAQNTILSYLGMVLGYVNVVLLFPNFFDTSEVGLVRVMVYIATFYAQFSALGSSQILLKYFPYYKSEEKQHEGILFWTLTFSIIGFIAITGVFQLARPLLYDFYADKAPLLMEYIYYVIPLALFATVFNLFDSYLRSLKKSVYPSFTKDVLHRFLISGAIGLYALGYVDFKTFVIAYISANGLIILSAVAYVVYLRQLFLKPALSFIRSGEMVEIMRYGLYSVFSSAAIMITTLIDALMLAAMVGLKEVGIYTTGYFITSAIVVPARSVYRIAYPYVAEFWKSNDIGGIETLYKKVTMNNLIFGLIIYIGIWINLPNIFALVPPEYSQAGMVILLIGLGRIIDMVTGINAIILTTSNKYKFDIVFNVALAILTVVTNYLLIPEYGINGAGFATFLAMSLINVIRLIAIGIWFKIHPFKFGNIWVVLIGGVVLAVNWLIPPLGNIFVDILIRSAIATSLFFGPVYLLKLSDDLNGMIKGLAQKIFGIRIPFG